MEYCDRSLTMKAGTQSGRFCAIRKSTMSIWQTEQCNASYDVEHPAPADAVSQAAANQRAQHRRNAESDADQTLILATA